MHSQLVVGGLYRLPFGSVRMRAGLFFHLFISHFRNRSFKWTSRHWMLGILDIFEGWNAPGHSTFWLSFARRIVFNWIELNWILVWFLSWINLVTENQWVPVSDGEHRTRRSTKLRKPLSHSQRIYSINLKFNHEHLIGFIVNNSNKFPNQTENKLLPELISGERLSSAKCQTEISWNFQKSILRNASIGKCYL